MPPHFVCLIQSRAFLDIAFFPCARSVNDALFLRAFQTVQEPAEPFDGPLQRPLFAVGGGGAEVKRLVESYELIVKDFELQMS